jgi:hypothetical protein
VIDVALAVRSRMSCQESVFGHRVSPLCLDTSDLDLRGNVQGVASARSVRIGRDVRFSSRGPWRERQLHYAGHIFDLQTDPIAGAQLAVDG